MTSTEPTADLAKDTVTVTVDGIVFEAKKGEMLIQAAQEHGVYIPRFCWHERMKPVGMCRMCLVEVEGVRGFPPACTTPVADGLVCNTQSDAVKKIQDGVLEFLLVNHPLDCPVCDRGGECPLQDQTLAFGPGESRFIEEKRHFEKPIQLSDLVLLDRERCIQCGRCTRFAEEIAGDPLIDFVDRGDRMQVLNFADQPFDSYFSGNTVQICPVGALTARQYRFKARPWDLEMVETSCNACAVQCRGALQSSSNRLVRLLGVDSEPVNHGWLCDKGRYGIEWVHSERRVLEPHRRIDGELRQVSWPDALETASGLLRDALDQHGPGSIALLGGARATNEDSYAFARLMKGVIGTDNVDAQMGDGLPAEVVLGLPRARIADCDRASAIVLLGPDLEEELPVLHLRVRRAALELGVPLVDLATVSHGLTDHATAIRRSMPGEALGADALEQISRARGDRPGPVVVVLGRASLATSSAVAMHQAQALRSVPDVLFLSALRRGNVHGAIDAGLVPGFLPGRVSLDAGRDRFETAWGSRVPRTKGLDAQGILAASAAGNIEVLVIFGCDPIADFPDVDLARRAIAGAKKIIAVGAFLTGSSAPAEVVLPCTLWGEKTGSVTNLEGRVQHVGRIVAPEGTAMDDWRIAGELAVRLGTDFDLATVDEVTNELARVAPAFAGVDATLLRRVRDGVVLPLREHRHDVVFRTRALSILADDGPGTSWDPIKVEGEAATDVAEPDDAAPELWTWDGTAPDVVVPPRDAYALRLVVGHRLYDNGRMVSEAPILQRVRRPFPLRINPHAAALLGLDAGSQVRLTSTRGSIIVAVDPDAGVPEGIGQLEFSADGLGAAELIDADATITDARVETLR
ncbi:MAG TPA: NADH-quinone oxidoreductase subunit NuoG [Acidimicrobiia bacterium]|nr:NADH-quinone oxidoreductase subunit NuoG [Acidimicrobiia bacterium]